MVTTGPPPRSRQTTSTKLFAGTTAGADARMITKGSIACRMRTGARRALAVWTDREGGRRRQLHAPPYPVSSGICDVAEPETLYL